MKKKVCLFIILANLICTSCNNYSNFVMDSVATEQTTVSEGNEGDYIKSLYECRKNHTEELDKSDVLFVLLQERISVDNYEIITTSSGDIYEVTYCFKEKLDQETMPKIDVEMKTVAYYILSLVNDLEKVSWEYEDFREQRYKFTITCDDCYVDIGADIKGYGSSFEKFNELTNFCSNNK